MKDLTNPEMEDMQARASRYPKVREDVARLVAEVRRLRAAQTGVKHELELSESVGTEQK